MEDQIWACYSTGNGNNSMEDKVSKQYLKQHDVVADYLGDSFQGSLIE